MSKLEKKKHIPEVVEVVTLLEENRLNTEIADLREERNSLNEKTNDLVKSVKEKLKQEVAEAQSQHARTLRDNASFLKRNLGFDVEKDKIHYHDLFGYYTFPRSSEEFVKIDISFYIDETKSVTPGFRGMFVGHPAFEMMNSNCDLRFEFEIPKSLRDSFKESREYEQRIEEIQKTIQQKEKELSKLDTYSKKVKLALKIEDLKTTDNGKRILDQAKQIIAQKNINAVIQKSIE